jgi:hypothetical protein
MTVYVDTAENKYGRLVLCHMLADSMDELMAMADKIGVDRKWYQGFDKASCPHFDIAKSKRVLAIQNGAIEIDRRTLGALLKGIKTQAMARVRVGEPHGWEAGDAN